MLYATLSTNSPRNRNGTAACGNGAALSVCVARLRIPTGRRHPLSRYRLHVTKVKPGVTSCCWRWRPPDENLARESSRVVGAPDRIGSTLDHGVGGVDPRLGASLGLGRFLDGEPLVVSKTVHIPVEQRRRTREQEGSRRRSPPWSPT